MKAYFKELMDNYDVLFIFKEGTSLVINGHTVNPDDKTLAYSLENNKFITTKPVYITVEKKKICYSMDNTTWYSSDNNIRKDIEGIKNRYHFDTKIINDNTIYIDCSVVTTFI